MLKRFSTWHAPTPAMGSAQRHATCQLSRASDRTADLRGALGSHVYICTDGEEECDSADEALRSDAARARRPDNMRTHHTNQIQTNPSADVISQKLLDTAPERKESTQDASTHIHIQTRAAL